MKYELTFASDEVRVTLTETLKLREGCAPHIGLPGAPGRFELIPQIQDLVREFLNGFVAHHDALQQEAVSLDRQDRSPVGASNPYTYSVAAPFPFRFQRGRKCDGMIAPRKSSSVLS